MDNESTAMRHEMERTLAGMTEKLDDLERQISGSVKTVKDSVNTVRNSFDLKHQVRQRPWVIMAAAGALGFAGGYRSRRSGAPRAPRVQRDTGNGARAAAASAPGWLDQIGEKLQPELAALRGIAVGALLEIVREILTKPEPKRSDDGESHRSNGRNPRSTRTEIRS